MAISTAAAKQQNNVTPLRTVKPFAPAAVKATCNGCSLRDLCLPTGLSGHEIEQLDLVYTRRRVPRGQALYRAGEAFESIYAVRLGYFKTDVLYSDGREQVTGFQMAGEVLGMDGICTERHTCNAVALEDSEVCVIQFAKLKNLSRDMEQFQHHFLKMMSREIVRDQVVMMLLGSMRAEERVAAFLVNLSHRFAKRGYSPYEFSLRMTREEIGSYLGLKLATVSRIFSKFQDDGLIGVHQKKIRIVDLPGLRKLMGRPAH